MKTATISLRVPIDFKANLDAICKTKNITMTDLCLSRLTPVNEIAPVNAVVLQKLNKGGLLKDNASDIYISEELSNILSIGGGTVVGILVYKTLKLNLQRNNPEWTDEKIEAISVSASLASALLSGFGLKQLTKMIGK
jgi:hypothetical protein